MRPSRRGKSYSSLAICPRGLDDSVVDGETPPSTPNTVEHAPVI